MASSQSDRALRAEAHTIRRALQDEINVRGDHRALSVTDGTADPASGATGQLPRMEASDVAVDDPVIRQVPVTDPHGPVFPGTTLAVQ
jgi:hypothetical protein